MHAADTPPPSPGPQRGDLVALLIVLLVTAVAYAPLVSHVLWLSTRTSQAVNAFILIAFVLVDILRGRPWPRPLRPEINHHGIVLFSLACVGLTVAAFTDLWPLAVLALCLNLAALLSFFLGRQGAVAFYPALVGLGLAAAMLIFLPRVDGLLRWLAAVGSASLLNLFGLDATAAVRPSPFTVVLLVKSGRRVFDVAAECNGFSILLSSVVLMAIQGVRRRQPWPARFAWLGLAVIVGWLANVLRIVGISVASMTTALPYGLIHEGIGTLVYLVALLLVYRLSNHTRASSVSPTPCM